MADIKVRRSLQAATLIRTPTVSDLSIMSLLTVSLMLMPLLFMLVLLQPSSAVFYTDSKESDYPRLGRRSGPPAAAPLKREYMDETRLGSLMPWPSKRQDSSSYFASLAAPHQKPSRTHHHRNPSISSSSHLGRLLLLGKHHSGDLIRRAPSTRAKTTSNRDDDASAFWRLIQSNSAENSKGNFSFHFWVYLERISQHT